MSKVYDIVTEKLLERLEAGTVPWRKPWNGSAAENAPRNVRGNFYRGINVFLLGFQAYSDPRWLTYNQAKALGGFVSRGQRGSLVIYWNLIKSRDKATGEVETIPLLRYYNVFNVAQCEGLRLPELVKPTPSVHSPIEACEAIAAGYKGAPSVSHGGDSAFYRPPTDTIGMPNREAFHSPAEYYSTLFHEYAHSTGAKHRLNREGVTNPIRFGSHAYSREELIAEMCAAFLMGEAGIEATLDNSAAYLASWIRALKADPKAAVVAAGAAQRAADHILGRVKASEDSEAEGEPIAA